MKSTGIVRRLDELGRITLPIELRRNFDINERDPLEIFVDDDKIILKKYNPADIFTGEDMDDLVDYKGPEKIWMIWLIIKEKRFLKNQSLN